MMTEKRKYIIRKAEASDCEAIYQINYKRAVYQDMTDQVQLSLSQFREDEFGDNPKYKAIACECTKTKKVFGFSLHYFVYSTWKGEVGYLEDVYLETEWRNSGIGTDMIKTIFSDLLASGCK